MIILHQQHCQQMNAAIHYSIMQIQLTQLLTRGTSSTTTLRVCVYSKRGDINSERYYLRAVPVSQITAYSDKGFTLTQNPGW